MNKIIFFCLTLMFSSSMIAQDWEELGAVPFVGLHHGVGFAFNGSGYVVSGSLDSFTRDVWKYDPTADSWQQIADYPGPMRGFSIGATNGTKGYFGFGYSFGGPLSDLWELDSATGLFEELTSCPCEPRAHPALVAFEDKLYMGMGSGNEGNLGDWYEYDIPTDTWTQKADYMGANRHHPYQFVIGDYIYVGSGHQTDWYRYHPATDTWSQVASHPSYTRVAGIQFAYEGKGYTLSGLADYNGDDHIPMPTGEFWEYDPEADTWTELPPHPGVSRWASASFIIDGWVYMIAGEGTPNVPESYRYFLGDAATSLGENRDELGVSLSPLPFKDQLNIRSDKSIASATVYGLNGALLLTATDLDGALDLSSLASGMYVLELRGEEGISRKKIIKE